MYELNPQRQTRNESRPTESYLTNEVVGVQDVPFAINYFTPSLLLLYLQSSLAKDFLI
jgi:hypothetical protein